MVAVKLYPRVLDFGLNVFDTETDRISLSATEPTTYSQATANALGFKSATAGSLFGSPADYASGRKIASTAITDGTITTTGTPAFFAALDVANSRLHATGGITGAAATAGQSFTLSSFTIDMPGILKTDPFPFASAYIDLRFSTGDYYDSTITPGSDPAHLLLHMDGVNASTTFTDSTFRHILAAVGNAQISTAQSKFGGAAALFDGTGDYLTCDGSPDFAFGTGDFTIDFWVRPTNTNHDDYFYTSGDNNFGIFTEVSNGLRFYYNGAYRITGGVGGQLTAATWYHIAITRASGSTRLFLNGTQVGSTYADTNNYTVAVGGPYIGANYASPSSVPLAGHLDELRVVKGTALWTGTFTAPTAAYSYKQSTGPYQQLSCTRASTGYAKNSDGTLSQFITNALRITDLGLLCEVARTNLVFPSADASDVAWTKVNSTITANSTVAPDGTTAGDTLVENTTGTSGCIFEKSVAGTTAVAYTVSIWAKASGRTCLNINLHGASSQNFVAAVFNLQNGVVGETKAGTTTGTFVSSSIEAYANGWYRCTLVASSITMGANYTCSFQAATAASGNTFTSFGDVNYSMVTSTNAIIVWGMQMEQASFVSSYIPTTTASVTRAADAIATAGRLTTVLSGATGSVLADVMLSNQGTVLPAENDFISAGAANTWLLYAPGPAINSVEAYATGGPVTAAFGSSLTWYTGARGALGWNNTGPSNSIVGDGGTVVTNSSRTFGGAASFNLGAQANSAIVNMYGYFRRIVGWTTKLADATLQGNTNPP